MVLAESDHVLNETLTQALTLAGCAVKISWLAVVAPRMEKLFIKIAMNNATARLGAVFAGFILFF